METAPAKETQKTSFKATPSREAPALLAVQQAIGSIKFGTVQIVIQDGRIVQIDKTEKIRLA